MKHKTGLVLFVSLLIVASQLIAQMGPSSLGDSTTTGTWEITPTGLDTKSQLMTSSIGFLQANEGFEFFLVNTTFRNVDYPSVETKLSSDFPITISVDGGDSIQKVGMGQPTSWCLQIDVFNCSANFSSQSDTMTFWIVFVLTDADAENPNKIVTYSDGTPINLGAEDPDTPTDTATPESTSSETAQPTTETPQPTDEPTETLTSEPSSQPPFAPRNLVAEHNFGRPIIRWSDDSLAQWFRIYIGTQNYSVTLLDQWFDRDLVCKEGTCEVSPEMYPISGTYRVWMQAWGDGEYSEGGDTGIEGWSTTELEINLSTPGAVEEMTAMNTENGIEFVWQPVPGATWYNIWAGTGAPDWTPQFDAWAFAGDLNCADGTCVMNSSVPLIGNQISTSFPVGEFVWYIRSWGPGGMSIGGITVAPSWAQGPNFTVQ